MIENVVEIIYYLLNGYVNMCEMLYVSKNIQMLLMKHGFMRTICCERGGESLFIDRCDKHRYTLRKIICHNIRKPFKGLKNVYRIESLVINDSYITNQLDCLDKRLIKEICIKNDRKVGEGAGNISVLFPPGINKFPAVERITFNIRSQFTSGASIGCMLKMNTLRELYLFTKYRTTLPILELPNIETVMVNGYIKKITSKKLKNLVCTVIYENTFINLGVYELDVFINGFGIYYKNISKGLLEKLDEWNINSNKYIRDMCGYIDKPGYRHVWENGITATEFMRNVIHSYSYRDSHIIYRGVKKLSKIVVDEGIKWGFEEIVFDP